ncbi:MAG: hypothetical protein EU541_07665 [Promethearchaeota archaeon]|nr:MAG: hypothetical protein EU541_07665 [Candidatus Lokiarchaeota archaeon]
MSKSDNERNIEHYKFHHIDVEKCKNCSDFFCEDKCFRHIYKVENKESEPKCVLVPGREGFCIKCHICTTVCRFKAIRID